MKNVNGRVEVNLRGLEGVKVEAEGENKDEALNLLFRNLLWERRRISRFDAPPEQLKEEFGQLLFQLFQTEGLRLDEVFVKRLSGRSERIVCYLDTWHTMEGHPGDLPREVVLKFGRRQRKSRCLSEEYRWRQYVAACIKPGGYAILCGEGRTAHLQGAAYRYEGRYGGKPTLLKDWLLVLSDMPRELREDMFREVFSEIRAILSPWERSVAPESMDVGAYVHALCGSRARRILHRLLPLRMAQGKIKVEDETGFGRTLQDPLVLLGPSRATAPLFRGIAHGDLTPDNVLLDPQSLTRTESIKPILIDFARSGPGYPLADWASLEFHCLMDPGLGGTDNLAQLFLQSRLSERPELDEEDAAAIFAVVTSLRRVAADAVSNWEEETSAHSTWEVDPTSQAVMGGYFAHIAALALHQVGAHSLTDAQVRRAALIAGLATEAALEML